MLFFSPVWVFEVISPINNFDHLLMCQYLSQSHSKFKQMWFSFTQAININLTIYCRRFTNVILFLQHSPTNAAPTKGIWEPPIQCFKAHPNQSKPAHQTGPYRSLQATKHATYDLLHAKRFLLSQKPIKCQYLVS